jgi:predicted DCC family thiol-disulfide oxidoreductase YuxK
MALKASAVQGQHMACVATEQPAGSGSAAAAAASGRHLVVYDGVCGLCNTFVQFVLPRDRRRLFQFASLQSQYGGGLVRRHGRDPGRLDTLYVIVGHRGTAPRVLSRARAVLFVLEALGGWWRLPALAGALPDRILNWGYDTVARHRYRMFGRSDTCLVPRVEYGDRFIEA